MHSPKISVIIPNYNHADHLRQRIESVLQQTYSNFELILLDDCSTDDSQIIISSYADHPRVACIQFNETNSGSPFKQWQKGLHFATGDWIWVAESDDYADHNFLKIMISAIDKNQMVGLIYCDSRVVNGDELTLDTFASIKNKRYKTDRWSHDHTNQGINEIENYLLEGGTINNSSAVLFNSAILKKINPFDLNLRYIGDKYAFIKVLAVADVAYVKESLNYYRDPFNSKHNDRYIYYFYEQFLVFDWVYRNLQMLNKKKFYEAFHANTGQSLFRDWTDIKWQIYKELFITNSKLMINSLLYNFLRSIKGIFS